MPQRALLKTQSVHKTNRNEDDLSVCGAFFSHLYFCFGRFVRLFFFSRLYNSITSDCCVRTHQINEIEQNIKKYTTLRKKIVTARRDF